MSTISMQDFQQNPTEYLARVEAGELILISRSGQPVVELRPVVPSPNGPRPHGLAAGEFTLPKEFFDPLPEGLLREFEGR